MKKLFLILPLLFSVCFGQAVSNHGLIIDLISSVITTPTNHDALEYNGTNWVNTATPVHASLGIGSSTPVASAILDIQSTTRGVIYPRLTAAQITAISSPALGLTVYNTDDSTYSFYNGSAWVNMPKGPRRALKTVTDTTTLTTLTKDVSELSVWATAGKKYEVVVKLYVGCTGSGGMRVGFGGPGDVAQVYGIWSGSGTSGATAQIVRSNSNINVLHAGAGSAAAFNRSNAATGMITFLGNITMGATSGFIKIQFAAGVLGETSSIFAPGSITMTEARDY